jgi:uracil-DNA glycosylase
LQHRPGQGNLIAAREGARGMKVRMPESWRSALGAELGQPYFRTLADFVDRERARFPDRIYPPEPRVFSAFELTPFDQVTVLLLGQDPYFNPGQAHGLCFSVRPEVPTPPSLRNIFKELQSDLGCSIPDNGLLVHWAEQGVLMLNTILTVRDGQPLSHRSRGWEKLTDAVIRQVSAKSTPVVFVLWGAPAQKKIALIDTRRHVVVKAAHPSPLSASRGFFGSRPFSAINRALTAAGHRAIDWQLPQRPLPTRKMMSP